MKIVYDSKYFLVCLCGRTRPHRKWRWRVKILILDGRRLAAKEKGNRREDVAEDLQEGWLLSYLPLGRGGGGGGRRARGAWWRGWQVWASWRKAGVRIPVLTLSESCWELMWRERVLLAWFAELGEVRACGRWAHALQSQEARCDSWFCSALAASAWTGDLTSLGFINQTWAIIAPPAEGCGGEWMRE